MLKDVFLDAGGVLMFPNWVRISDALASYGVEVAPEALAAAEPHAKRQLDRGHTVAQTDDSVRGWLYFNLILAAGGVALSDATAAALEDLHAYHDAHNLWELVPGDVAPALQAMRQRGLRLTVVSNANGTLCAHAERVGLSALVDCILDSCEVGVEKPDPRIFEIALDRNGADRETTIHVGDFYEVDVVGARAAGIRGVLLDAAGLYDDADCPRVRSLEELVIAIQQGRFD